MIKGAHWREEFRMENIVKARSLVAFVICSGHQLLILEPLRHRYGQKHKIQFTNFILALQRTCMIRWMLHSSAILLGNQLTSFLACNWVSSISTAWSKGRGGARNSPWQRVQDVKRYQLFTDWIDQREKILSNLVGCSDCDLGWMKSASDPQEQISATEGVCSLSLLALDTKYWGYLAVTHSQTEWHEARLMESRRADHSLQASEVPCN